MEIANGHLPGDYLLILRYLAFPSYIELPISLRKQGLRLKRSNEPVRKRGVDDSFKMDR